MARYFEDFTVGDEIEPLVRGPITTSHVMRWSAAIENWHRIHYDYPFATEHEGLPGILVNGSWKQHMLVQLVKDAIGHEGWLWRIRFRYRAPDLAGEVLTARGRITACRAVDGVGFVSLDIGMDKSDGTVSTDGRAIAAVPLRGRSVPYPFQPTAGQVAAFAE